MENSKVVPEDSQQARRVLAKLGQASSGIVELAGIVAFRSGLPGQPDLDADFERQLDDLLARLSQLELQVVAAITPKADTVLFPEGSTVLVKSREDEGTRRVVAVTHSGLRKLDPPVGLMVFFRPESLLEVRS